MLMQNLSTSLVTQINDGNLIGVIGGLESDFSKVVSQSIPTKQLINQGARANQIEAAIALLISKFAKMLSVGGNLKEGQSVEIAKMLLEEYPTMSLDDFNLMLSRGVRGRYGEIFRFDVAIIFGWAGQYMEEWAEEKERQLAKAKNKLYEKPEPNAIPRPDVDKEINELLEKLKDSKVNAVPKLTREEIRAEGRETPPRKKAAAYIPNPELIILHERKMQWIRECTESDGGDGWKLKEGSPTFEAWLEGYKGGKD